MNQAQQIVMPKSALLVRKSITVAAAQARAFEVFTTGMSTWWPLKTHHIGAVDAAASVIEPRTGGRWYERGVDGSECEIGRVLLWQPHERVLLAWELNHEWKYDTAITSQVEVRFIAEGPKQTRVELEHRALESYGERGEMMRGIFDSEGGWTGLLQLYAQAAAA